MMKKYLNKLYFTIRYAVKNILFGKLKSLALLLTFTIILAVVFLILSTRLFVSSYYNHQVKSRFYDYDLIMTVDENTNARFFSIRKLENDKIINSAAFFEVNTIFTKDRFDYVKVMTGSLAGLKGINNNVISSNINSSDIIITKSLADLFSLEINDVVNLKFANDEEYKVIEIVEDDGEFFGNTVFIDKDTNLGKIFSALNINISIDLTKNLFNKVYLDVSDENIIKEIKAIDDYKNLKVTPTYNKELVNQNIKKTIAAFGVIFIFVLAAILLVLESTLSIMFKDRVRQIGVIKSLGGRGGFFLRLIFFEVFIYLLIALAFSVFLTSFLINYGLTFLSSKLVFSLSKDVVIIGSIVVLVIIYIIVYFNYYKVKNTSIVSLSQDNKVDSRQMSFIYLIVFGLAILINLIFNSNQRIRALINIILGIIIGFLILKLLLKTGKVFKGYIFKTLSIKNLNQNKTIFHNINIVLISFVAIFIMITTVNFNDRHNQRVSSEVNIDFMITNIVHDTSLVVNDVRNIYDVDIADDAYLYRDIKFADSDAVIEYMISLDSNKIIDYFNFDISDDVLSKLQSKEEAYILLPKSFKDKDGYEVDDKVYLDISEELKQEEFIIAGFMDVSSNYLSVTNIANVDKYSAVVRNVIIIKANDDRASLYQELIEKYQSKLYYVIDYQNIVSNILIDTKQMVNYLNYVSYILIVCFILTIFNNTILIFNEMKTTYAKLRVLGFTNKSLLMMVIKENLYLFIMVLVCAMMVATNFVFNVVDVVLIFGAYYPLDIVFMDYVEAIIVCVVVYVLSYIYYIRSIYNVNVVDEIKKI